jgi:two-component system, chemotaxis family, CheB/CheR fusion protein
VSRNAFYQSAPGVSPSSDAGFDALVQYLARSGPVDLQDYNRDTLMSRVERRMGEIHVDGFAAYQSRLIDNLSEHASLAARIFVNHTSFFRDTALWKEELPTLLSALFATKAANEPIRMWSAGCASGQEAYSLAMLSAQILGDRRFRSQIRIMATDVDEYSLMQARAGRYRRDQMTAVSEDQREVYFKKSRERFVFRPDLRKNIIFGVHNLLADTPFRRMDLVLCRNTLMYFNVPAQARVLNAFYFSLGPNGHLILGRPERPQDASRFASLPTHIRIYSKVASVSGSVWCNN